MAPGIVNQRHDSRGGWQVGDLEELLMEASYIGAQRLIFILSEMHQANGCFAGFAAAGEMCGKLFGKLGEVGDALGWQSSIPCPSGLSEGGWEGSAKDRVGGSLQNHYISERVKVVKGVCSAVIGV